MIAIKIHQPEQAQKTKTQTQHIQNSKEKHEN